MLFRVYLLFNRSELSLPSLSPALLAVGSSIQEGKLSERCSLVIVEHKSIICLQIVSPIDLSGRSACDCHIERLPHPKLFDQNLPECFHSAERVFRNCSAVNIFDARCVWTPRRFLLSNVTWPFLNGTDPPYSRLKVTTLFANDHALHSLSSPTTGECRPASMVVYYCQTHLEGKGKGGEALKLILSPSSSSSSPCPPPWQQPRPPPSGPSSSAQPSPAPELCPGRQPCRPRLPP